jgi:beta-glucosidase
LGGGVSVYLAAHHALARRAAAAGAVLLTNDGTLPLAPRGRIAVIGAFAEQPRYQGAGSSLVQPTRLDTALDAMRARLGDDADLVYAPGYDPASGETTPALLAQARRAATGADAVVLLVGLPTVAESEGFDRTTLRLPEGHETLVEVVTAANRRTVVALSNGGAVEVGWVDRAAAVLECYLGGQAGGTALVDVLFGDAEPGGRLAESFPVSAAELPAHVNFATHPTQVQYRETLYSGTASTTPSTSPRGSASATGSATRPSPWATSRSRGAEPTSPRACWCATPGSGPARRSSSSTCTTPPRACTGPSRS